ncbi:hypothetical protein, partial [Pseudomonas aeruginosa]|uniref:hypothetical protein n=1 Tax=Pseudomonas aeruginosa TaxID=287 RepID=UPI001ABCA000
FRAVEKVLSTRRRTGLLPEMRGTGSNAGVSPVLTERAGVFALASPWASLHTDGLSEARCRACPTTDAAKRSCA